MLQGRINRGYAGRGKHGGFTIVELLVVTLIIVVLCSIAYPVVVKAKESARTSECLSNMRQIGIGLNMYIDSYNGRFPSAVPYGSPDYWNSKNRKTIQELLLPYVRNGMVYTDQGGKKVFVNPGVFACPSDSGLTGSRASFGVVSGKPVWKSTGCSYEYYASIQEDWQNSSVAVPWTSLSPLLDMGKEKTRVGAPLAKIPYVTKKAVIGELSYWHMGDKTPDNRLVYANTLFADGHAARVNGSEYLNSRIEQLNRWHTHTEITQE